MEERFKLYLDRMGDGEPVPLTGTYPPELFEVEETDLTFRKPVQVTGQAYTTDDHLVLHFDAQAVAHIPCSICNEWVEVPLQVKGVYETIPLSEIEGYFFDFHLPLREALLLELPPVAECKGKCPQRETLAPFMRHQAQLQDEKPNFPFSDL